MNKVYRVVWNSALNAWIVASEFAARRGAGTMSSTQAKRLKLAPCLIILLVGGTVVSIAPLANATQASRYDIPLCKTDADCQTIIVGHDRSSNKATVETSESATINQMRRDGKGATDKASNSNNNTWMTGNYGVAIGQRARSFIGGVTYGSNTWAAEVGTAIGTAASAVGEASIAFGSAAYSSGAASIAQGLSSYAGADHAIALGTVSTADGNGAMAYGYSASASGTRAIAMGTSPSGAYSQDTTNNTQASGSDSIALGTSGRATGQSSMALGNKTQSTGNSSIAIGDNASGTANGAIGMGSKASASGVNSIATGISAAASGVNSIATGVQSIANAERASAYGSASKATAIYANALGASSNASGAYSFAEGKDSKANGYSSTAIGNASSASDQQAIAVGLSATATGRRSIAIGPPSEKSAASTSTKDSDRIAKDTKYATKALAADTVAMGAGAQATAQYASALGTNAIASNKNTVALGKNTVASGLSAVAIGYDAKGSGNYTVSIGEDSSAKGDFGTAVGNFSSARGAQSSALGYRASASQTNASAFGANTQANGVSSTAVGSASIASGESSLAAGASANASGAMSTSVGAGSQAFGENASSLGRNARSEGDNSLAAGYNAAASEESAIALGNSAAANKQNAVAMGNGAQATEAGAMAYGQGANAAEVDSIAIGNESTASGDGSMALGKGTKSAAANGVALGEGADANRAGMDGATEVFSGASVASQKGAVSVGSTDNERQIINVAGGTQDTDAVNVRQLKYVGTSLASSLGGGAAFDSSTGTYTAPTFTNNDASFNNVAAALSDVNNGAVKYERGGDGSINKDKVTLEGGDSGTTLDNVANGTVSSSSQQAVNGSQLYGTSNSVANALGGGSAINPDGTVSNPSYTVHNADGSTTTANNVGDALSNVDTRTAGNTEAINNFNSGKAGLTQQQAAGEKITVGKDTDGTEVSFADKDGKTRTLNNVTAARISSDSTNAVNGSQLHAGNLSIANALGGGSTLNADGTISTPAYHLHTYNQHSGEEPEVVYGNVSDALSNVDNRMITNTDQIREIAARVNPAGEYGYSVNGRNFDHIEDALRDIDADAVKYDRNSDGSINTGKASLEGIENGTVLDNVANGAVSSDSKQAVNGSQLYATNQAISEISGGKSGLTQQVAPDDKITVGKDTGGTEVSFNDKNSGTRRLTGVSNGDVSATSKEAVNGSQLYTEQTQRQTADSGLANALGGGAKVADDGSVTAPTYNLHDADNSATTVNNVGEALINLDDRTVNNTNTINQVASGKSGIVQQQNNDAAITVGKDSNGKQVTFADKNGSARKLINISNGDVNNASKDAVNGSQLYGTTLSIANSLGGGSTVNADGTLSMPVYTLNGKQYVGVDQALQSLGQSVDTHSDSGNVSATGDHSAAMGAGATASGSGATASGDKAAATGSSSTAYGANSVASNTNSTATGKGTKATGENATATGASASAKGKESTATGVNASASGDYATANGVNTQAAGSGSTASGHGAKATADNSSAFGKDAIASGTGSTAGGNAAKASGDSSTAYGQNATADGQNSVALGAGSSTDARDNTVSVGSSGSERTISNVADGTQPHDAATVGQISRGFNALGNRIDKVERHAKAGTASAMAMTGLPQAALPGRSMLSAGGGTYEGQSAVAVGLSTMTDNGRWIIKGQVSGNTQGDVGGAMGIGYQW